MKTKLGFLAVLSVFLSNSSFAGSDYSCKVFASHGNIQRGELITLTEVEGQKVVGLGATVFKNDRYRTILDTTDPEIRIERYELRDSRFTTALILEIGRERLGDGMHDVARLHQTQDKGQPMLFLAAALCN